jgi:hypothetical protein
MACSSLPLVSLRARATSLESNPKEWIPEDGTEEFGAECWGTEGWGRSEVEIDGGC